VSIEYGLRDSPIIELSALEVFHGGFMARVLASNIIMQVLDNYLQCRLGNSLWILIETHCLPISMAVVLWPVLQARQGIHLWWAVTGYKVLHLWRAGQGTKSYICGVL